MVGTHVNAEGVGLAMLRRVAKTFGPGGRGTQVIAEADARLIVRAVNQYDAHVQAVEALRKIEARDECGCDCATEHCCVRAGEPCAGCEARAALRAVDEASKGGN